MRLIDQPEVFYLRRVCGYDGPGGFTAGEGVRGGEAGQRVV